LLEINKIYCVDNVEGMKLLDTESIDLTVTSPPYDDLRDYNGYSFDFEGVANQLYRVTKAGGIVVWVIGDETKNFQESLSSFKQAIHFVDNSGFYLLDTMIYLKNNVPPTYPNMKRYSPAFEYMFVFSKGKPKCFNPIKDRENKNYGKDFQGGTQRQKDGSLKKTPRYSPQQYGMRFNYWNYTVGKNKDTKDEIALNHPARFPEKLAEDHIISWSNERDLVLDPFMGSGTTAKMAKLNNRNYIGFDSSQEYCDIANNRLNSLGVTK